MKNIILVLSIIGFGLSPFSVADTVWSAELSVEEVITEDSDVIVVSTDGGAVYQAGCIANKWVFSSADESKMGRMYSTMLTAFASGKKLKIYNKGECGLWNYHGIHAMKIIN